MNYFKKLIGNRIFLSPKGLSEEEIAKFTEWMNDFQITDYTGRSAYISTLLSEKKWLEDAAINSKDRYFNIVELNTNKLIGTISLVHFNWVNRTAILGIFIGDENYRGNGYGSEALNLLLDYGFNYLNLHSIRLDLLETNERAHQCYLKCGFTETGKSRDAVFLNGKYHNVIHMDILESEFKNEFIKNKNIK